ncbi:hypothetical protein TWF481_011292 [Arthrobotrys musiformis]|uniref:Uncharacterized protein n=1 Tax=Arthrobotrys musiformis TaxID=47236 RepID=A0AAV9VZ14_9PEZI
MHMSLPEKFPDPLTRKSPITRLRNIILLTAATFFILTLFIAIKIYFPPFPPPKERSWEVDPELFRFARPIDSPSGWEPGVPFEWGYRPPTPFPGPSIRDVGGKKLVDTRVYNGTQWYSVGRPPGREDDCWDYASRFDPYIKPDSRVMERISNSGSHPDHTRAFIVRLSTGQPWGREFAIHARSVVLEAGLAKYDVIFLLHSDKSPSETRKWMKERVPREFHNITQSFSTNDIKKFLNGTAPFKNIMENNHLAIQMFVTKNKKYDFVYSIESDVRLIGRWDHFLQDVDEEYKSHRERQDPDQDMPETPDLVTFAALKRPSYNWMWLDDKCIAGFGGREGLRTCLGPMWGWSRRLIEKMNEYNAKGVNCYYEYFAPTVAYKENLTTFFYQHPLYCPRTSPSGRHFLEPEEVGKNDPRTVQYQKVATGCTYFFVNPHSQPFWEQFSKSRKHQSACWPWALVHPIKGQFFN